MSAPALKRYRIVVIEWLTHDAVIEAEDEILAEDEARRLWADNAEHQLFRFRDLGIDGFEIEGITP